MDSKKHVEFVIPGEPTGKGRPKFHTYGGHAQTYTPEKTVNYETLVKLEYAAQCGGRMFGADVALGMSITAYLPILKATSKRKAALMLDGQIRPGKKPDWDNVGKVVCDALNKIAFYDDAQIVDGRVIKRYSDTPRVFVEIWEEGTNG